MMPKLNSVAFAGAMAALAAPLALGLAPAFAQNDTSLADAYRAGVDLGRTLHDPRQCTGHGDFYDGCVDGVTESRFDQEADQALDGELRDAKPAEPQPLLSPPPGMFQDPFSKPGDSAPPNN